MSVNASFVDFLKPKYPEISLDGISDRLICTTSVKITSQTYEQIKTEITQYRALRQWTEKNKKSDYLAKNLAAPKNFGVCDSYDFHVDDSGHVHLIEVNTNAAFLALGLELYEFFEKPNFATFDEKKMLQMFRDEIKICGANENCIYIIDEKPQEQRLFIEFLIYQQLFKKNGIDCKIVDATDAKAIAAIPTGSFVYNRHTDFYLAEEKSSLLKSRFNSGELHLSPHPWEYFQIADKQRFLDWSQQTEVAKPKSLLQVFDLDTETPETIRPLRKKMFFKPKSSFGSKGVFNGSSISTKVFDSLFGQHFIAQEIAPPAEIDILVNGSTQKMKYDLRCYTYREELQLIIARVYQGQTTNLRTEGGGFAIVELEN